MLASHLREVSLELVDEPGRKEGDPVLASLAVPSVDAAEGEVDVGHAQAAALREAKARAVEKSDDETGGPVEPTQNALHLLTREDECRFPWNETKRATQAT